MKPSIINKNSNFVIITYWWGRGNKNKNTQRPCPYEEEPKLTRPPITYDKMITTWIQNCKKANCNYMSIEYPEFAQKGMYQKAINFKPLFIKQALKACHPRAVVYIDGDMIVHKYPHIFDMKNIDLMSQGWNSDPRYEKIWMDEYCYDPYVFETSGGIFYFGNTPNAINLLDQWNQSVLKNPLKAEDRLISQIFNSGKMLLNIRLVQLPIEYLWINDLYEDLPPKYFKSNKVFVSHPACLTSEEMAFEEGADKNRYPVNYTRYMTNKVVCNRYTKMPFYEYIFFDNKNQVQTLDLYLTILKKMGFINIIPYSKKFGPFNKIAARNKLKAKEFVINVEKPNSTVLVIHKQYKGTIPKNYPYIIVSDRETGLHATISCLEKKHPVIYIDKNVKKIQTKDLKINCDFSCKNKSKSLKKYKKEYTLNIAYNYPVVFNSNDILLKLLYICKNLNEIELQFNSTIIFISRLNCSFKSVR